MKNILVIDDELSMCTLLEKFLSKNGFNVESTISGKQGVHLMKNKFYDVILCDYRLTDITAEDLFDEIKKNSHNSVVIFITGYANLNIAVNLIKEGAYHYLAKPLNPDELLEIINNSLSAERPALKARSTIRETASETNEESQVLEDYVYGSSPSSKKMLEYVRLVGPTNYTVIIKGETGTGKESLARLIHMESTRRSRPFMPLDCGS